MSENRKQFAGISPLHQFLNCKLAFWAIFVRRATDQHDGRETLPAEIGRLKYSRTPEIPAQNENQVRMFERLGADQVTPEPIQCGLPAYQRYR